MQALETQRENIMLQRVLSLLLLFSLFPLANSATVSIRADEWYPVNGKDNGSHPGYMIELAREILTENGHRLDYQTLPWVGSITMVRKGSFDCVVGADTNDAPDFIFTQKTWGFIKPVFYVKKGKSWKFTGIDSLKHVRLGVIGSYAYSEELDKYVAQNKGSEKVQVVNADKALRQNIGKLLSNRLDVVVEFDLIMDAKLNELGYSQDVIPAGELTSGEPLYLACGPNKPSSAKYVDMFSNGIIKMRENGTLQKILDKYGLADWE